MTEDLRSEFHADSSTRSSDGIAATVGWCHRTGAPLHRHPVAIGSGGRRVRHARRRRIRQPLASSSRNSASRLHRTAGTGRRRSAARRRGDQDHRRRRTVGRSVRQHLQSSTAHLRPRARPASSGRHPEDGAIRPSVLFKEATEAYLHLDAVRAAALHDMDDYLDDLHRQFIQADLREPRRRSTSTCRSAVQLAVGRPLLRTHRRPRRERR